MIARSVRALTGGAVLNESQELTHAGVTGSAVRSVRVRDYALDCAHSVWDVAMPSVGSSTWLSRFDAHWKYRRGESPCHAYSVRSSAGCMAPAVSWCVAWKKGEGLSLLRLSRTIFGTWITARESSALHMNPAEVPQYKYENQRQKQSASETGSTVTSVAVVATAAAEEEKNQDDDQD